jgi:hypothetical protein
MTSEEIIKAWNNQADKHNQWSDLSKDEMLEFAMRLEREACCNLLEGMNACVDHTHYAQAAQALRQLRAKR